MRLEEELNDNPGYKKLCEGLANLKNSESVSAFLRDLCTFKELSEMSGRIEAAGLIKKGLPYREIYKKTGVSTATITRIAYWMKNGMGGYDLALSHHHPPETPTERG